MVKEQLGNAELTAYPAERYEMKRKKREQSSLLSEIEGVRGQLAAGLVDYFSCQMDIISVISNGEIDPAMIAGIDHCIGIFLGVRERENTEIGIVGKYILGKLLPIPYSFF